MKFCSNIRSADAKEMRRQGELAFTMVEIALAIGVIGFALVAIIGILPAGMSVQKDNREDTVISQDAPYFLDAIRNGAPVGNGTTVNTYGYLVNNNGYELAQSVDFLTNYVQQIRFDFIVDGVANPTPIVPYIFSNFTSGAEIIGLLTTPQTNYFSPYFPSNYFDVTATVRALSGPATSQQSGTNSGLNNFIAFTYKLEVMVTPFNSFAYATTNYLAPNMDFNQSNICFSRWVATTPGAQWNGTNIPGAGSLTYNLFDVRLRFSWPVLQNGNVGPGRQTYRTLVAAPLTEVKGTNWWFFQPQTIVSQPPPNL